MNNNKCKKIEHVLNTAEEEFINTGFQNSKMSQIANKAGVSRRTLYRYFPSKDLLAFEIEFRIFSKILDELKMYSDSVSGTGYEKTEKLLNHFYNLTLKYQDYIKFTAEFDHYYIGEYPHPDYSNRIRNYLIKIQSLIAQLTEEGIEDGSIRNDIDLNITYKMITNAGMSLAQRLSLRGSNIEKEQNIDQREIAHEFLKMSLYYIKSSH